MDREDLKYVEQGLLVNNDEIEESLEENLTNENHTTEDHKDYILHTFKGDYSEQYVFEYKTLKGILQQIMDNFINNKDYMTDDMTLYIEYNDGSTYYLGGSFDDGKFKKTGIKNVIIDDGTYAVYGDWIPRMEGGALYIETPFTNKGNEELEEDLTQDEKDKLEEIDNLINDLYALRQQSIQEEGEYGIGNLVFKEFRNLGYLDNLKKIKRQLLSKQLSLESLNEVVKVDKIKLSQTQDRRIKLTSEDKEQIRQLYSTGDYSLNDLAKQFNVSKKTILLIVNQESKAKSDERIKNHWKDYYDKDKHSKAVKDTREYKKGLLSKGEIQEQPKLIK